jgi:hypothetical protein
MQKFFFKQQYRSLFVSLLLHALLLYAVVSLKMKYQGESEPGAAPGVAARVSYARYKAQTASAKKTAPAQSIPKPQKQTALKKDDLSTQPALPAEPSQSTPEPVGLPVTTDQVPGRLGGQIESKTKRISGKAFMNAFKRAVQTERFEEEQRTQTIPGIPPDIQHRLSSWGMYDYRQKVHKAFAKATLFNSRFVRLDEDFNKTITVKVPILKNGKLGDVSTLKITGIKDIDDTILKVLKDADFPPIPNRFGLDMFYEDIEIHVNLPKGSNFGQWSAR